MLSGTEIELRPYVVGSHGTTGCGSASLHTLIGSVINGAKCHPTLSELSVYKRHGIIR